MNLVLQINSKTITHQWTPLLQKYQDKGAKYQIILDNHEENMSNALAQLESHIEIDSYVITVCEKSPGCFVPSLNP